MTTNQAPLIAVRELTKTYRLGGEKNAAGESEVMEVRALRGVTIDVLPAEFVALTGPSGSGKSTFMHLLGCLDRPTSGDYMLNGQNVSQLDKRSLARVRNREIGFVFQGFNLLPRTSAIENVELPLLYGGVRNAKERRERAAAALQSVGLGDRLGHHPNQLSGGQQQRVAIARALVGNPKLLLADEPTGNLDTRTSIEVMGIFQRLNQERGLTIVLVTHEPDIAEYGTRIIGFRDGRVKRDEPVASRREASADPETRRENPTRRSRIPNPQSPNPTTMSIFMTVNVAIKALRRNAMRTALTALGMIIGVAAVIVMVAIGTGARTSIENQIRSAGSNIVMVNAGSGGFGPVRQGQGAVTTLTADDAEAIRTTVPGIRYISPGLNSRTQIIAETSNWNTQVQGTSEELPELRSWPIQMGSFFSAQEVRAAAKVAVLGSATRDQLFGVGADPVGATIRINNQPFRVIGVLSSKGQAAMGQDQDDVVMTPYTTVQKKLLGCAARQRHHDFCHR